MDEEMISKKDLLEAAGISYGQLYRWKRKKLIPEEWFIRKSTYTGQETFFPRDKILERINKIKNMKDDLSLDDMAEMFSPELSDVLLEKKDLIERNIVSQEALDAYERFKGTVEVYSFEKILYVAVLDRFLRSGAVGLEEGKMIVENLEENFKKMKGRQCEVVFLRKFGTSLSLLMPVPNEFYMEKSARLVERISLQKCIEELKPLVIRG
jgi:DNA-binding transcriptional MerR regulator